VQFNRGRMSGSGVGFTYDKQTDRLWLLDKAVIKFAPEGESPGMEVTSGSAGHSRAERYLRFERGMRMTRAGQIVEATDATVFLFADRDESDRIELRGNASITGAEGTGTLQKMLGRDINLDYADDGRTLQQAIITEQASITLAGAEGATGQEFAGDWIDVTLAPDGALTHVAGNGNVKVTLPATGDAPVRTVTAPILDGKGETGAGLKELTFDNGVEYREAAGTGATQAAAGRVARARTLRATLGKSGTIDEAEFTGGFQFEEGRMETTSSDARYQIARGHLVLKSVKGATRPRVKDERLSINADSIEVSLNPRSITAAGDVSTTLASGRKRPGERGTTLLKQDEDVSVRANKLVFDDASSAGVYTGRARLFQGQTSISAEEIKMDDKNGNLVATTNVVATLPIAGKKEEGKETHSIARADEFRYDDAKRLATLTKKARLDGGQGNVTAEQIRMLLAPADNGLTRLEAQDTVKVVLDKKEATGSQLVYDPADESYFLQGAPVRLVSGGCRETTGGSIKFFGGSERLIVDSQENRTQTRGDSKCPETPRE
jgi:lipopolysaccharide transport protein LptA